MSQDGAMFTVDFSEVPDREPVPDGEYVLEAVHVELKTSKGEKTTGTPMLVFHWKVIGGEMDNRRIFDNALLGGNSLWRTKQLFEAIFGKGQAQFSMAPDELIGSQVLAKVVTEVWAEEDGGDGESRNRIGRYKQIADLGAGAEASSLDAMFKAK